MARDRKERRRKAKVPVSSPSVPKLPYYSKLRREQVIKDRRERDVLEEYPKVGRWPTENVRRRSYSYGMVHDGDKWVRDVAFPQIRLAQSTITVGTDTKEDMITLEGRGVFTHIDGRIYDRPTNRVLVMIDNEWLGGLEPDWLFNEEPEPNWFNVTRYDDVNGQYVVESVRKMPFTHSVTVQGHNRDTAAAHDISVDLYYSEHGEVEKTTA